ncbi:ABC transporter substrate-binding protein [Blastococcus sp. SYSU DS0973]
MRLRSKFGVTLLAAALAVTACGGSDGEDGGSGATAANPDAALIFFDASGNETLDPAHPQNNSSLSYEALLAIYDRLIHLTDEGDPEPGLAEEWEYNEDLTELTLTLREGATFHDGEPVNADAVIANFERMETLDQPIGQNVQNTIDLIDSYAAPDEQTVVLTLSEPSGQMEYWLSANGGMMVSPAALTPGAYGSDFEPIGAGPYEVESFQSNVVTNMARYEDYWGGTEGRPARFEHHYVTDGQARLNAVRSGEANLALLDANQIPVAEGAGLEIQVNPQLSLWNIYTNLSGPDIGDVRVRQAIMHAIDRQALVEALTFGTGTPSQQLFPEGHPVWIEELDEAYPYDPERARELLAEAGKPEGVDIDFVLLNNTEYRQLAEALQQMLARADIRLTFDVVDISQASVFRDPAGPQGEVMMARWGGRADPLMTFQEVTSSSGTYTPGGVANPRIDELVAQASALTPENPERLELIREINRVVTEEAATFPIMMRSNVFAYSPGCIDNLTSYLAAGDDLMNDVTVSSDCA